MIAIKCIEGIDSLTNNFTTMPNVPGEYGSALERSTFQLLIYQTALNTNPLTIWLKK